MVLTIFCLLVLFQIKHFVVDYTLQTSYMLQKFRRDWGFFFPLLAHAGLHATFTLAIVLLFAPHLWWLALVDLVVHFIMDRIKAGPKYLGKFECLSKKEIRSMMSCANISGVEVFEREFKGNTYFWWSLGFDQMIHHLTHYYIIFYIVIDEVFTKV
jgi:hypothetical protein